MGSPGTVNIQLVLYTYLYSGARVGSPGTVNIQ